MLAPRRSAAHRLCAGDFRGALDVLVEITNLASSERCALEATSGPCASHAIAAFKLPAAEARSGDYFRLKILEGELTRLLILLIEVRVRLHAAQPGLGHLTRYCSELKCAFCYKTSSASAAGPCRAA